MQLPSAPPVDEIDLSDVAFWAQPIPAREAAFATLRRERPISFQEEHPIGPFPAGPGYWAITRHADVIDASRRPEVFCSGEGTNIFDMPVEFREFFGSMINMDDPRHARLRKIVSSGFTPRWLKKVEDDVQRAASRIVDEVSALERADDGRVHCDFVTRIAARLPLMIICDMMGIPAEQYDFVFERSNTILGAGDPEYVGLDGDVATAILTAGAELSQLVMGMAEERRSHPTDDLTSALANAEVDGERLTDSELGSFFVLLAVAGNETTRNAISHGLDALSHHPVQRDKWAADFEGLAPTAVEEIVRWATPVIHFRRTVTTATTLGGQDLEEGQKVVLFYSSANRDEDVFDDPFTFDITRQPNDHVGFGGPGPHFCLGAHLARREITVMFRELLTRLPDIEATDEPDRLLSGFINGIKHLPCAFTPAA